MAGYGMPFYAIGTIMGFGSKSQFDECVKKNKHLRQALELGKAAALRFATQTAYNRAFVDEYRVFDRMGNVRATVKGDTTMMIFWLKTQARWKETKAIEVTGQDGEPVAMTLKNHSDEELKARYDKLKAKLIKEHERERGT
jgi:hypothetical protein